jgi:SAM-dependent methyltransferase
MALKKSRGAGEVRHGAGMPLAEQQAAIGQVWDSKGGGPRKLRWGQVPAVVDHINRKFGEPIRNPGKDGALAGFNRHLAAALKENPPRRAISIGCGFARHERYLLERNMVERIDLFDLAEGRINKARELYERNGVAHRATFNAADAFLSAPVGEYDLVYWKSSLHHMMSARQAVGWSWRALRPGGVFAMFDFVGASRFQWSDRNLAYANAYRSTLPQRFFRRTDNPELFYRTLVPRPSLKKMIANDPSEAADSSNIIPSVLEHFPGADIIRVGGAMFHLMSGIFDNLLTEPDGDDYLAEAIRLDDFLLDIGECHFAACVVRKP